MDGHTGGCRSGLRFAAAGAAGDDRTVRLRAGHVRLRRRSVRDAWRSHRLSDRDRWGGCPLAVRSRPEPIPCAPGSGGYCWLLGRGRIVGACSGLTGDACARRVVGGPHQRDVPCRMDDAGLRVGRRVDARCRSAPRADRRRWRRAEGRPRVPGWSRRRRSSRVRSRCRFWQRPRFTPGTSGFPPRSSRHTARSMLVCRYRPSSTRSGSERWRSLWCRLACLACPPPELQRPVTQRKKARDEVDSHDEGHAGARAHRRSGRCLNGGLSAQGRGQVRHADRVHGGRGHLRRRQDDQGASEQGGCLSRADEGRDLRQAREGPGALRRGADGPRCRRHQARRSQARAGACARSHLPQGEGAGGFDRQGRQAGTRYDPSAEHGATTTAPVVPPKPGEATATVGGSGQVDA